jgi:hypothetical protein
MSDTNYIDEVTLYKAIKKAFLVTDKMGQPEQSADLALDPNQVEALSRDRSLSATECSLTENYCLLHQLGRLNYHTTQIYSNFTGFNGMKILHLSGHRNKVPIGRANPTSKTDATLPMVILHIGSSRGLNLIPRKFNRRILDLYDVQLENLSLVVESPEAYETMEISLANETSIQSNGPETHIIILPWVIDLHQDVETYLSTKTCLQYAETEELEAPLTTKEDVSTKQGVSTIAQLSSFSESTTHAKPPSPRIVISPAFGKDNNFYTPREPSLPGNDTTHFQIETDKDTETTPVSRNQPVSRCRNLQQQHTPSRRFFLRTIRTNRTLEQGAGHFQSYRACHRTPLIMRTSP